MLDAFVDATLEAIAAGDPPDPIALTVVLRVYAATGRDDLAAALGPLLAAAAAGPHDAGPTPVRAGWLHLYAEAARLSDDARLREAAEAAAAGLLSTGGVPIRCAEQAEAVHAVLAACPVIDSARFAPPAVDQLERLIAADYEPGAGLRGRSAADIAAVALALLAAFDVTGRLAYPMLAEELIRAVRDELAVAPPPACCAAARVLGRLARLHDDDGYRAAAVVAPGADYTGDSRALLEAVATRCRAPGDRTAYALALTECGERS